ncbi:MAG: TRAP transporter substrate-binding protein DctP [Proteobacteria bacterium]|nr:TRAP transporter substrate-binding protein DctP [Pseudomonadota bacterium]
MGLVFSLILIFPSRLPAEVNSEKPPYQIKFGTMSPADSAWTEIPNKILIPLVNSMFGNKLKLVVYYGGIMGDDQEILEKIKEGKLDACSCTNQGTVKVVPDLSVLTLPLLFQSYDEIDFVTQKLRKYIETRFEEQGFKLLFIIDTGFLYFFSKDNPSTFEKMRTQKVFSWFGEIQERTFNYLGINPISITIPELAPSISKSMTNAGAGPASWLLATQMYPYMKYVLEEPLFYGPSTGFISKRKLDFITSDLRAKPAEFSGIQRSFSAFQNSVAAESYLERKGIRDEKLRKVGRELISWIKQQKLESPEQVSEIIFRIFRESEAAWLRSIREFEAECFRGFFARGMKKARLEESDRRTLLLATGRVWDEFSGQLYPSTLLSGIKNRLIQYRAKKSNPAGPE